MSSFTSVDDKLVMMGETQVTFSFSGAYATTILVEVWTEDDQGASYSSAQTTATAGVNEPSLTYDDFPASAKLALPNRRDRRGRLGEHRPGQHRLVTASGRTTPLQPALPTAMTDLTLRCGPPMGHVSHGSSRMDTKVKPLVVDID